MSKHTASANDEVSVSKSLVETKEIEQLMNAVCEINSTKTHSGICPVCHNKMKYYQAERIEDSYYVRCECYTCGISWNEEYTFAVVNFATIQYHGDFI